MSVFPGFVGGAYTSTSPNLAAQTLYNWYPQSLEAMEPTRTALIPRPGLVPYLSLSDFPVRGGFSQDDRVFVVAGQTFYEMFANRAPVTRGTLTAKDANPVTIDSNGQFGHQLFITSAGHGDIYDLQSNTLTPITAAGFPVPCTIGTYLDSYFMTTLAGTVQWNISTINTATGTPDGSVWDTLDVGVRVSASDNLVGLIAFNKIIWLIGSQTSEPWYDTGAVNATFEPLPQVLIPAGCCAPYSIVRTTQAVCWLHQSERGRGVFISAENYAPTRLSTYALEEVWATYPTLSDAVAYAMAWRGHEFILVHFPTGNATWVYDILEKQWSNWSWWNPVTAQQERFRGWVHWEAFGHHFVGDWETSTVYALDPTQGTDNGVPIVWERQTPHVNTELAVNFFANFCVDMETGLGGTTPLAQLAWSDDGGHTFGPAFEMTTGVLQDYTARCRAPGSLGSGRNRVFRFRISNTAPPRVLQAYLDVIKGTS